MDWALVLASQQIETVVAQTETGEWQLVVDAATRDAALESIRKFQEENRHWRWQRALPRQDLVFDWAAVLWVGLISCIHLIAGARPGLVTAGIMDGAAVLNGEWWRCFTATMLHADAAHLAGNAVLGFVLLALAMGRFGTGVGVLAALVAGAVGNVFAMWMNGPSHHALGASGVVMGALGLLAAQPRGSRRQPAWPARLAFASVAAAWMLFVLVGLSPNSDVAAHFGGFLAGTTLGWVLSRFGSTAKLVWLNLLAGFGFLVLICSAWWAALLVGK